MVEDSVSAWNPESFNVLLETDLTRRLLGSSKFPPPPEAPHQTLAKAGSLAKCYFFVWRH